MAHNKCFHYYLCPSEAYRTCSLTCLLDEQEEEQELTEAADELSTLNTEMKKQLSSFSQCKSLTLNTEMKKQLSSFSQCKSLTLNTEMKKQLSSFSQCKSLTSALIM